MLHIDDRERIDLYRELLMASGPPSLADMSERTRRLALMLHFDLWGVSQGQSSLEEAMARLWAEEGVRDEIVELLAVLDERSERLVARSASLSTSRLRLTAATAATRFWLRSV